MKALRPYLRKYEIGMSRSQRVVFRIVFMVVAVVIYVGGIAIFVSVTEDTERPLLTTLIAFIALGVIFWIGWYVALGIAGFVAWVMENLNPFDDDDNEDSDDDS